jgi:hypothetical protein
MVLRIVEVWEKLPKPGNRQLIIDTRAVVPLKILPMSGDVQLLTSHLTGMRTLKL